MPGSVRALGTFVPFKKKYWRKKKNRFNLAHSKAMRGEKTTEFVKPSFLERGKNLSLCGGNTLEINCHFCGFENSC